ncbi:hypothetical protein L226DRAFT_534927 [Lentinus tigrinus ALCF2SS1-7]|uniref:Uncharacterized protein n=1 Tax=Lentinus tigrinus ALCF2SS1-6 TaxID=1328759 RepID=A0A5C2S9N5_9APHY|nr:hypothetical protein L227DRAFT_575520 [Lentinus tigrinus ALCF2SS1-6]RPD74711.1 hypothetical protein L226DRAFT_534927 [Lentinus tigrinus ALCF2SS1-7]
MQMLHIVVLATAEIATEDVARACKVRSAALRIHRNCLAANHMGHRIWRFSRERFLTLMFGTARRCAVPLSLARLTRPTCFNLCAPLECYPPQLPPLLGWEVQRLGAPLS